MRSSTLIFIVSIFGLLVLPPSTASATGSNRAWVSGSGVDQPGCGTVTSPCRQIQYAISNIVAPGGEIDIEGPSGFSPITITSSISIINDGVGTASIQQPTGGQSAISIAVGPTDVVELRGLSIDGVNSGQRGINFTGAGTLTMVNCVVRHFVTVGISIFPSAGGPFNVLISNSEVSDNYYGIYFFGGGSTIPIVASVSNTIIKNNSTVGVYAQNTTLTLANNTFFTLASSASTAGLYATNSSTVFLSRNVFSGPATNTQIIVNSNTASVASTGDNVVVGNISYTNSAFAISTLQTK